MRKSRGPKPFPERFWKRVLKTESCWIWTGARIGGKRPYGVIRFWKPDRNYLTHRISWMLHFGDIPEGMDVCHHCDNPPCVNPSHLFLGTRLENMADAKKKGRTLTGERCPRSKLKEWQVKMIPKLMETMMQCEIADLFGVSRGAINSITRGLNWKCSYNPSNSMTTGECVSKTTDVN